MDTVSISEFRGSFREHTDRVISEHEPLKVTGRRGADFMVIGADDLGTRTENPTMCWETGR